MAQSSKLIIFSNLGISDNSQKFKARVSMIHWYHSVMVGLIAGIRSNKEVEVVIHSYRELIHSTSYFIVRMMSKSSACLTIVFSESITVHLHLRYHRMLKCPRTLF